MVTAWAVLDERITSLAMVGTVLILTGVYLAERKAR
jgi:drug/metabolite transporter (DMT)-like permease